MNTSFEKFITPFKELSAITVENMEKLADLQLKALEENTKIGLEQLKNASTINDVDTLKSFLDSQAKVTKEATERALKDSRTVVEMGNTYTTEVQRIVKESLAVN